MNQAAEIDATVSYAPCIGNDEPTEWDIEAEVIRGLDFDFSSKFLPDSLTLVDQIDFLTRDEQRLMSQIQGRTYANAFALLERFNEANGLEVGADRGATVPGAPIPFGEDQTRQRKLFQRVDAILDRQMPAGYRFVPRIDDLAAAMGSKSTWSFLALACCVDLFPQVHYAQSIFRDPELCKLYKDIFRSHWQRQNESQFAVVDEIEWVREDARLNIAERDRAIDDLIALISIFDDLLQLQSECDVDYFIRIVEREFGPARRTRLSNATLTAYRRQYIVRGMRVPRFKSVLAKLLSPEQRRRIAAALGSIAQRFVPQQDSLF